MLLFGIGVSNYIGPCGQKVKGHILIKYAHFGRYGAKKKKFVNILIYDRALCALWRKATPASIGHPVLKL